MTSVIRTQRLHFIGHCIRCTGQYHPVRDLILWQSSENLQIGQGNKQTYIKQLREDLLRFEIEEILEAGNGREVWKTFLNEQTFR